MNQHVDPVLSALERGEDTRGMDHGPDANEPDDSAERAERERALAELAEV